MIFIVGILSFIYLSFLAILAKKKSIISNIFIFTFFWCIIVFFSLFHFYELYSISDYIYILVDVGITFYFFGDYFGNKIKCKKYENLNPVNNIKEYVLFVAICIILIKILVMLPTIISEGIGFSRYVALQNDGVHISNFFEIIELYFAKPYLRAYLIYFSIETFYKKIKPKNILILFILVLISYLEDGGRTVIINEIITIIAIYIFIKITKNNFFQIKTTKYIKIIVFLICGIAVFATLERGSEIFRSIYTYYCGSLVYFSENISNINLYNGYLMGNCSLQGFYRPIFGLLNIFNINDPIALQEANNFILGIQNTVVYITPKDYMNYFITCFGVFYKDFGFFGEIICPFIYGFYGSIVDKKILISPSNKKNMAIKILFVQGALFSMTVFCFSTFNYVMTYLYLVFIYSFVGRVKLRFYDN